jgi:hypothetical protein
MHKYYFSYNFAVRPLDFLQALKYALLSRIRPQKFPSPCNVTPGGGGRRGWGIPARAGGGVGRGRACSGLGVLPTRFGKVDRAERRPATTIGGAPGWRPRRCVFRQGGSSVGGGSEPVSYE